MQIDLTGEDVRDFISFSPDESAALSEIRSLWQSRDYELQRYDDITDPIVTTVYDKLMLYALHEIIESPVPEQEKQDAFDAVFDTLGFPGIMHNCWTYRDYDGVPSKVRREQLYRQLTTRFASDLKAP